MVESAHIAREATDTLSLWNLWLFFVPGYGIIWASMIWANRKRGKAIEDPELYQFHGKK